MKIKLITIFLLPIIALVIMTSCSTINANEMKNLKTKEFKNYTLYYQDVIPEKQIKDYDEITDNMYIYMTTKMGLEFEKPKFKIAVLPIQNKVANFKKRNTNACTDYNNIYLIDMFNLSEEIYEQYGEPPEGIANDAFSHELAHLMSHNIIDYKNKNRIRPNEMNSIAFSYIDFTTNEFKLIDNVKEIIKNNLTNEQMKILKEQGLGSFKNSTQDRSVAIFLLYLHSIENYEYIKIFLEADNIEDYIKKVNWNKEEDKKFVEWLEKY